MHMSDMGHFESKGLELAFLKKLYKFVGRLPPRTGEIFGGKKLCFVTQILVRALKKRSIDESLRKVPSETPKCRRKSLILPSQ